jgi:hypothetical protein
LRFERNSDQIDEVKKMRKAKLTIIEALIAMLALVGGSSPFVLAGDAAELRALTSDGKAKKGNDSTLDLNDIDSRQSEMRSVIERYSADRGSLARFYSVEASSARQARMKQFYSDWLATLAKLDFDSMSQDGRIDYLLFKNHLVHELRQLDLQVKALAEVAALVPFAHPSPISKTHDAGWKPSIPPGSLRCLPGWQNKST